jgi:molecular chaperone DnaK
VKDAEKFAEEDRKRKAQIEARNQADNAHYQVQKFIQDNGDKLADADKKTLQEQMDAVKSALDRNAGTDELERLTNKLMDEWQKVGAKMHQESKAGGQTPPPGAGGPQGRPGGEDVVDGEYRKV